MAAYVTVAQVRSRSGGFLTGSNVGLPDTDISQYITEQQEVVDGSMSQHYAVPFDAGGAVVPPTILRIVRDLACADSIDQAMAKDFGDKEHPYAKRLRDAALKLLENVANGPRKTQAGAAMALPGVAELSQLRGALPPLDVRNLLPQAPSYTTYDPTDPNVDMPTNMAGTQDSDLWSG